MLCNKMLCAILAAVSMAAFGEEAQTEVPAWRPRERWCGFNLLGMFCQTKMAEGDKRIFGCFPEDRFQWMHEWGLTSHGCRSTIVSSSRRATG